MKGSRPGVERLEMPWWLSHPSAGLDIGTDTLKWSAVEPGKLRSYLLSAPLVEERTALKQPPAEPEREQRLLALIEAWRTQAPVWPKKVAVNLQGWGVVCDYIEFPALRGAEIEVALSAALARLVPFPPQKQVLAHQNVPALNDPGGTGVFYTVSLRHQAVALRSLISRLGLEASRLEAIPLALTREFARNHKPTEQQFTALIHCGYRWTHVVVQRGGFPYYARDFALAGGDFTRSFQAAGHLAWAEAEYQKLSSRANQLLPERVESAVRKWLERVRLHLDNFCGRHKVHLENVFLSGGSAAWPGLRERLEQYLEIPTLPDEWDRMKAPRVYQGQAILYKAAMGLALAGG